MDAWDEVEDIVSGVLRFPQYNMIRLQLLKVSEYLDTPPHPHAHVAILFGLISMQVKGRILLWLAQTMVSPGNQKPGETSEDGDENRQPGKATLTAIVIYNGLEIPSILA